jgi:hypothetical protein
VQENTLPGRNAVGGLRLDKIGEDGEQPTEAELNTWIAGFPIEPLRTWHSEMTAL